MSAQKEEERFAFNFEPLRLQVPPQAIIQIHPVAMKCPTPPQCAAETKGFFLYNHTGKY